MRNLTFFHANLFEQTTLSRSRIRTCKNIADTKQYRNLYYETFRVELFTSRNKQTDRRRYRGIICDFSACRYNLSDLINKSFYRIDGLKLSSCFLTELSLMAITCNYDGRAIIAKQRVLAEFHNFSMESVDAVEFLDRNGCNVVVENTKICMNG